MSKTQKTRVNPKNQKETDKSLPSLPDVFQENKNQEKSRGTEEKVSKARLAEEKEIILFKLC